MSQFRSWGIVFSDDMYHSSGYKCKCGFEIPSDFMLYDQLLVGFSTSSTPKEGYVGVGIFECPQCFEKFWFHFESSFVRILQEELPKWPK